MIHKDMLLYYLYEYIKDWERDFFSWNLTGK